MMREPQPSENFAESEPTLTERFTTLLETTAEQLQIMTTPDESTREVRHMAFGRAEEDTLSISHTNNLGYHTGTITFISSSAPTAEKNAQQSFIFDTKIEDAGTWRRDEARNHADRVLELLGRHWPLSVSSETIQQMLEDSQPIDDDHPPRDVEVEAILNLLENYSTLQNTGEQSYENTWVYTETSCEVKSYQEIIPKITFTVLCEDETFGLNQIRADLVVPYDVDDATVPITYHVHIDNLGRLFVGASYKDPETNSVCSPDIKDPESCYEVVQYFISQMIDEKLAYTRLAQL